MSESPFTHYSHSKLDGAELDIRDDIDQSDLEKYTAEYQKAVHNKQPSEVAKVVFDGAVVRAAQRAGWLLNLPKDFNVGKLAPAVCRWMSETIDKHYAALVTIPNE